MYRIWLMFVIILGCAPGLKINYDLVSPETKRYFGSEKAISPYLWAIYKNGLPDHVEKNKENRKKDLTTQWTHFRILLTNLKTLDMLPMYLGVSNNHEVFMGKEVSLMKRLILVMFVALFVLVLAQGRAQAEPDEGDLWKDSLVKVLLQDMVDILQDTALSAEGREAKLTILADEIGRYFRIVRIQEELADSTITEERRELLEAKLNELKGVKEE